MTKMVDLAGQRFGRLVVLHRVLDKTPGRARWAVLCDCGTQKAVNGDGLRSGRSRSCGCLRREMVGDQFRTHGETGSAESWAFYRAKTRCNNPNVPEYRNYGGRGIKFCFDSLEQFILEVGRRPTPDHSLDRIDVDGDYAPGNVRWATLKVQNRNKRTTRMLTFNGRTQCQAAWAEEIGMSQGTLDSRLNLGWSVEDIINTPVGSSRRRSNPSSSRPPQQKSED
jgi:hypothetical protein